MSFEVHYTANGEIRYVCEEGKTFEGLLTSKLPDNLRGKLLLNHYVDSGMVVEMPTKPSVAHHFDYDLKDWVRDDAYYLDAVVRPMRNSLLAACDWTQLPDVPLATKEVWATYRQALRDVTININGDVVWPTPPN